MGGDDHNMEETLPKRNSKPIMTAREVALYLRLSQAKVYRLARTGDIPAIRIGKTWRFRKDLIDAWFCQQVEADLES